MTAVGADSAASEDSKLSESNTSDIGSKTVADISDRESSFEVAKRDLRIFKIIVIGDSNVGKTCLTYRFCEGAFPKKVEATIGVDFREKTVDIGGELLKLQLWDTAGQERFRRSMVTHYYRNVHAVVYVYDMTNRDSFISLKGWLAEYGQHSMNQVEVPRILIGNKCDLSAKVTVSSAESQMFADTYNMPVFETSALDSSKSDHVESIFMTIAHKLKASKPMMGSKYSRTVVKTHPEVVRYTAIGNEGKPKCAC